MVISSCKRQHRTAYEEKICTDGSLKISIITPCYNAADTIEQTILSVLEQDYPFVEYIIIDGGSTDGTVDIIRKHERKLAYWSSEPDKGLYDALAKGFEHVSGDVCAYINADDFYQPHAFATVCEIFRNPKYRWITGVNATYNVYGQIVGAKLPFRYRSAFIEKGLYDGLYLPFIQQESTFWRTELMRYVDMDQFRALKLAGDYYLWKCFSLHAKLDIVNCVLSGFRKRKGQLSEAVNDYRQEMRRFCSVQPDFSDRIFAYMDKLMSLAPGRLNKEVVHFDFEHECWGDYKTQT